MTTSVNEALLLVAVMAAAIFFCRVFPFLFFRGKNGSIKVVSASENESLPEAKPSQERRKTAFLAFVEKTVPPVAMTVLAFNSLAGPVYASPNELIPMLGAAAFTAIVHVWRRNPLNSIFGGTALYMILIRVLI
jgi:branched-subunit amino acid transport protein AzlD